jgi:hypothetical protein
MAIRIANNTVINDSRGLENITNLRTVNSQNVLGTGNIDTDTLPVGALQYFSGAYSTGPLQQFLRGSYGLEWEGTQGSNIAFGNGIFVAAVNTAPAGTLTGSVFISQDGLNWENIPTSPRLNATPEITFGNGRFVIVTTDAIHSSTDARTWTSTTTASTIPELTFGNGVFVRSSAANLFTSTDGITWTARTSGTTSSIRALHHGGGLYLYGTVGGGLSTSTDAITWTPRTSGTTSSIISLFFANGLYLYGSTSPFATSTDAVTWTNRGTRTLGATWFSFYNNLYLMGAVGGQVLQTSTDAVTWSSNTSISIPNWNIDGGQSEGFNQPVVTNDRIVFPSFTGQCRVSLSTPYPGTKWLPVQGQVLLKSTYPQLYAQVGSRASFNADPAFATADYVTPVNSDIRALASNEKTSYTSATLALAGNAGVIATSTNGITWTTRTSGTASNIFTMIHANNQFVYGAFGGALSTSTDAITWTPRTSGTTQSVTRLTYGNGLYMYATTANSLYTSTDAVTWTQRTTGEAGDIAVAKFAGEYFYSWRRYSRDGITWLPYQTNFNPSDVAFGNGVYIMAYANILLLGTDGINFTRRIYVPGGGLINRINFLNDKFVAFNSATGSAGPFCGWSSDGVNWTWNRGFSNDSIEFFNNRWVYAIGDTIYSSRAYGYNTQTEFALPFPDSNLTAFDNTAQDKLYIKALP